MIVTIVATLSVVMIATPVMAQNMTGGNIDWRQYDWQDQWWL